jgi:hypothetical protein
MESMMLQSARDRLKGIQSKLSFEDWVNPQFAQNKVRFRESPMIRYSILNLFQFSLLFHIHNPQVIPFSRY